MIFAPQEDTQLLYYDVQKWFNQESNEREQKETEEGKGFTMLYPFAAKRAERAAKNGARLRAQQHTVLLKSGETVSFSFAYLWADHFLRAGKRMAQEGNVTVDGISRKVPEPFIVMATQNPKGSAGTQTLRSASDT